jgi:hypothetical protein
MTIANKMHTTHRSDSRACSPRQHRDGRCGHPTESKYYQFWRPITAIRESDLHRTERPRRRQHRHRRRSNLDAAGAPASNRPARTSRRRSDYVRYDVQRGDLRDPPPLLAPTIAFTIVSDEWNGITTDNQGHVRPLRPRTFNSLSEAEEENGQSRIYLGIHFAFDKNDGIDQGRRVADYVWSHAFTPTGSGQGR